VSSSCYHALGKGRWVVTGFNDRTRMGLSRLTDGPGEGPFSVEHESWKLGFSPLGKVSGKTPSIKVW